MTSRQVAVEVVRETATGAYTQAVLHQRLAASGLSPSAARRAAALAYLTVRLRNRCDHVLARHLTRPLADCDPTLQAALRVGVCELLWTREAAPAAVVHSLVEIVRQLGHDGLAKVANGVLRNVLRADWSDQPPPELDPSEHLRDYLIDWESYPPWLVERWLRNHGPDAALALCQAGNQDPCVTLWCNPTRVSRDELLAALTAASHTAEPSDLAPLAVRLTSPGRIAALPGFAEGWFTVQDEAAQVVVAAAGPQPGMRAIDLCAAPGGKACQLAAAVGAGGEVIAVDLAAERLTRLDETIQRLGLDRVTTLVADGRRLPGQLDPADLVLVDAPCTGTGTLARRADLRWRLDAERLEVAVRLQAELIEAAAALVKPGGLLVYATCSLEPEENGDQMVAFDARHPEFAPVAAPAFAVPGWDSTNASALLLPEGGRHDGFYLAVRRRTT